MEIFKKSRYQNAFVSSEFLFLISIDAWQNIINLLKRNNIQIAKLILVVRNPQKRFVSILLDRVRNRKYNKNKIKEAYSEYVKNELEVYKKIEKLNQLFGKKLSIIDYDFNKEDIIDKIFEEADLKKGFPYDKKKLQRLNKNNISDVHLALMYAIIDNRLLNFLHSLIVKARLDGLLLDGFKKNSLIHLLNTLPAHQKKNSLLPLDNEFSKLIEKINKKYSTYTHRRYIKNDEAIFSIATLKIKYFFKYLLILLLVKSNLKK